MRFSGSKLKALRVERQVTREQVSVAIGSGAATIRNWEQGVHVPDANALRGLVEFFDVPMEAFFDQAA